MSKTIFAATLCLCLLGCADTGPYEGTVKSTEFLGGDDYALLKVEFEGNKTYVFKVKPGKQINIQPGYRMRITTSSSFPGLIESVEYDDR